MKLLRKAFVTQDKTDDRTTSLRLFSKRIGSGRGRKSIQVLCIPNAGTFLHNKGGLKEKKSDTEDAYEELILEELQKTHT